MDPITHTLTGAALAQAGLKRRTPLATATLIIGANLPDVDIASYAWGSTFAWSFRRGWTHGVLALVVLPFVLTGIMLAWDRFIRRARRPGAPPAMPGDVLLLAFAAVLTHPLLDSLNVYGMRWLMPFSSRWSYGDTLFIIDPWVWAALVGGVYLSSGASRSPVPARIAIGAVAVYIVLMAVSMRAARSEVRALEPLARDARIMVAPVALNPFRRYVVIDEGTELRVGSFRWLGDPRTAYEDFAVVSERADLAAVARARRTVAGRRFLGWARFPFFEVTGGPSDARVHMIDARYGLESSAGFGTLTIDVEVQ